MTVEEQSAWTMGVVASISCVVYLVIVLTMPGRLADASYVAPMLWTLGAAIVIQIVLNIAASMRVPKGSRVKDQRDLEIGRFGDHIGQSFVAIGGLTALVLAMAEADHFWIANAIYLGFTLSGVLGSAAKVAAYRRGFQ
ncbi:hypothetical protein JOF56_008054 [Kibdelosporangium banguiense]|uniref:DUF2178 domain-containing protein n=1 Tax=Kibdelosporangium banguiense TaxID=1365924 RepID=A0ABS4TUN5_9PSEU|nr:hypothetical protein [Kibdelosporangium banguiense]MBP2327669.1 hypothetical protein [Kibdelosporangium banguiense]